MGQIKVKVNSVKNNQQQIASAASTASNVKNNVRIARSQVDAQIRARNNIDIRLQNVANMIESSENRMYNISGTVLRGVSYYQSADQRVIQMKNQLLGISGKQNSYYGRNVSVVNDSRGKSKPEEKKEKRDSGKNKKKQKDDPLWKKILLNEYEDEISVKSGHRGDEETVTKNRKGGYAKGDLIGASYKVSTDIDAEIKFDEHGKLDKTSLDVHVGRKVEGEGHIAQGEVGGCLGLLSGKLSGKVGAVSAEGSVGASLFEKGKFAPKLQAKAEASASTAHGEAEGRFGGEKFNAFAKAEGDLASASASADAGIGRITVEKDGRVQTTWGANANVSAEAYLAKGSVSGGLTILGYDIDIKLEGKAGGAGVEAGAKVTTDEIRGKLGLGLGLGLGIEVGIGRAS